MTVRASSAHGTGKKKKQVGWRKLGPHLEGLLGPSHEVPWISCWLGPSFSSSSLMLLFSPRTSSPRTWTSHHGAWREFGLLLQPPRSLFIRRASGWLPEDTTLSSFQILFPPCAAPFAQALLGWLLHALEMIFAMLPHRVPLTVSLASHLLDIFSTMVWLGLAICWRRPSERTLSVARCMRCPLFHAVSPSPGLVKLPCALQQPHHAF